MDNRRRRTARIGYNYCPVTGSGELDDDESIKIHIHSMGYSREEYSFALSISHPNFLPSLFMDPENEALAYQQYHKTLPHYLAELNGQGIKPVMTYQDSNHEHSYDYVPQEYRSLTKAMIKFILYLHSKGKSLVDFDLSLEDFVFQDGVLKFWRVRFRRATKNTKQNDFMLIFKLLQILFAGCCNLPHDFDQLLHLMMDYDSKKKNNYLIENHLSIMTTAERINFFKNCYDKKNLLPGGADVSYYNSIDGMGDCRNWNTKLNDLPEFSPILDCYDFRYGVPYTVTGSYIHEVNRDLIRFCRNLATHLKDHCENRELLFTERDIELMVMLVFEKELTTFQRLLHASRILNYFID